MSFHVTIFTARLLRFAATDYMCDWRLVRSRVNGPASGRTMRHDIPVETGLSISVIITEHRLRPRQKRMLPDFAAPRLTHPAFQRPGERFILPAAGTFRRRARSTPMSIDSARQRFRGDRDM
jgi:hypothetical protein